MEHPRLQQVNRIDLMPPSEELSGEGIRYVYKADTDLDIIKIDIVFKAGRTVSYTHLTLPTTPYV